MPQLCVACVRHTLLATSLYDDPAAELHEDVSARLRQHLPLPRCSILRRCSPVVRRERLPGSRWRPRRGAEANHRERPVLGTTALRIRCRTPTRRAWALFRARGRGVQIISSGSSRHDASCLVFAGTEPGAVTWPGRLAPLTGAGRPGCSSGTWLGGSSLRCADRRKVAGGGHDRRRGPGDCLVKGAQSP